MVLRVLERPTNAQLKVFVREPVDLPQGLLHCQSKHDQLTQVVPFIRGGLKETDS